MNLDFFNALMAMALGVTVGGIVYGVGTWIDQARDRRWQREIENFNEWDES